MTKTQWDGFPKNRNVSGYHIIASTLGRDKTVYAWSHYSQTWYHANTHVRSTPDDMRGLTYIGFVTLDESLG